MSNHQELYQGIARWAKSEGVPEGPLRKNHVVRQLGALEFPNHAKIMVPLQSCFAYSDELVA